mmetsp:Transcript_11286/g.21109  ORF Transcript_11286/g.21109 Transcript_11286/m.21109 type:complete len:352 (-) Transcript_11286:62-1117(-)
MGRVARYKKVKACEKVYTGDEYVWGTKFSVKNKKRSATAENHHQRKLKRKGYHDDGGRDLPPDGKDDFNLSDFVVKKEKKRRPEDGLAPFKHPTVVPSSFSAGTSDGPVKPQAIVKNDKVKIGNTIVQCSIPLDDREEIRAAKLLKIDPKTGKSTSKQNARQVSIEGRRKGESMNAFHRRLKEETVNALAENYRKQREPQDEAQMEKIQRKKEYAKMRKLKKKGKLVGRRDAFAEDDEDDDDYYFDSKRRTNNADDSDGFITGEQAAARASFLEQVEEPPVFNQLPRGAVNKSKLRMASASVKSNSKGSRRMDEDDIKAEQTMMEIMRRKVQAQYAIMKAKRKQEGSSFHL